MAYTALYRKWRPTVFEDVVGQTHITQTIKNQIRSGRIGHAYLFCGTRGTGKTSTAKIFSRAINCMNIQNGNPCNSCEICTGIMNGSIMDVVEIDAASNNGVDNIREIRDEVAYSPAKGKYKVYIIDEVHMLSVGAFNALLKTLEEPPAHVLFILATTEPHKIPATILSRCQRFDFKRITTEAIVGRLKEITDGDHIQIDEKSLRLVARVSDGSMRDALSILDQCIAFSEDVVKHEDIASILGVVDNAFLFKMSRGIVESKTDVLMELIEQLMIEGRDVNQLMEDLINHFRNLLMCKVLDAPENVLDMMPENVVQLKEHSNAFTQEKIINCIKVLSEAQATAKWAANPRIILEIAVMKLCQSKLDTSPEALLDRIAELEQKFMSGAVQVMAKETEAVHSRESKKAETTKEGSHQKNTTVKKNKGAAPEQIKKIIALWPEVIDEVRKNGKVVLFGYLTDTKVQPKDDGIAIIFKNSFATNKMMVARSENIQFIKEMIQKLSGESVNIQCYLERELDENPEELEEDKLEQLVRLKDELGDTLEIYDE